MENVIISEELGRGEGTGPISEILNHISILVFVYRLV